MHRHQFAAFGRPGLILMIVAALAVTGCTRRPKSAPHTLSPSATTSGAATERDEPAQALPVQDVLADLAARIGEPPSPPDPQALEVVISPERPPVADGYNFSLWLHESEAEVWLLRQGGIMGEWRWFGPLEVDYAAIQPLLDQTCRHPSTSRPQ